MSERPDHTRLVTRSADARGPAAAWQAWWSELARSADGHLGLATNQGFVLTAAQLDLYGVTRSAARAAVRRGEWCAPARGVIAPLRLPPSGDVHLDRRRAHALHSTALQVQRPSHVIGARSGAVLHGLPVVSVPPQPQLLSRRRDKLGHRSAGHALGARLGDEEITDWFGIPVTTVSRTLVELARHDRFDGIMAADAALRERLVTPAELETALLRATGWPGVRTARDVLTFADPLAESPLESVVRLRLHLDGFPPPVLQAVIGPYRVDFHWPAQRLVLEADGRVKYDADALWQEKQREHALRGMGQRVERVLWSDLGRGWPAAASRLRDALR